MIKNNKGQYYAVECENLFQMNEVLQKLNRRKFSDYAKYVSTGNGRFISSEIYNHEIIQFNDWMKLTQQPETITLPIEDYNRLRKLEIKKEIKRLKKELKGL